VGIGINPKLAARIRDADLILALGVRLGEMTTGGYTLLTPPRPAQRWCTSTPARRNWAASTPPTCCCRRLAQAAKALESLTAPPELPWRDWTAAAAADYVANHEAPSVEPLDLAVVMKTVQRLVPADAVYTNGAGNYSGWLHRFVRYPGLQHHGRTQLAPTSGAMGYGLPAAVAAALLYPERTVVNIAGDGDFLMTGQELATATGYGARRLVSIVVDNGTYGTIRMHQEREYPGRVSGSDLCNPDFAAFARAFGWHAARVERTAEFEPALKEALAAGRPALLHLKLDTDVITSRTSLSAIRDAALLESPGQGAVLVVDGAGSLQRALVGGNIAAAAAKNGWAGVLVNGAVRDKAELAAAEIGLLARALCPMPSNRQAAGQVDVPVQVEGIWIKPGDWLYADEDGVVVNAGGPVSA
jgi:acetolactate synthase-1/2/3 large subunit